MATKLEKALIITTLVVVVLVSLASLFVFLFIATNGNGLCLSPDCMRTAVQILDNMDLSVDPCEDFYMFACGNYIKTKFIPEDKTEIDSFSRIEDLLAQKLRILLEEPVGENEIPPFKFIKSHFNTCLNSEQDNTDTLKYLLRQLGGVPIIEGDNWNSRNFDWRNLAHKLRRSGFVSEMFLSINAEVMLTNSTQRMLEVDEPQILYKEYLRNGLDDKITTAIYDLMVDIWVLLGAEKSRSVEEMKSVIRLLVDLARISVPPEEKRASAALINIMTIEDMELTFPIVKWFSYINQQLMGVIEIDKNFTINVLHPRHLKRLNALLLHNDERTISNFMFSIVIFNEIQYLNQRLRERYNAFLRIADGNTENIPRWKECVNDVNNRLPMIAGALYVRNFLKIEAKDNMRELVDELLQQFKKDLSENVPWMEMESRKRAESKVDAISTFIGYPDELLDDEILTDYFADLGEAPTNYLLLDLKLTNFSIKTHYKFLMENVNKTDWRKQHSPIDVNAFYDSSTNSIHFPAGILQDNFFDHRRPSFVNFGGIGFLIGHEITHGFDDEGRLFDENGNLIDWWSEKTRDSFLENALCIVEQYDNITVLGIDVKVNGANSQGENIADNGGIKLAYSAYKNWLSKNGRDKSLPGFSNYTNEQMFWMAAASSWCSKMRPEKLKYMLLSDEHVPFHYRINIPFANSEYFAQDFGCRLGTKMNPFTKCKVW